MHVKTRKHFNKVLCFVLFSLMIQYTQAQKVVPYQDDYFVLRDFRFADGSSLDSLRLHYYYLGTPHLDKAGHIDNAVLIMHGTGGNGASLLTENFAGYLCRDGQILDAHKYFIIFPDAIGHGKSSKPSDG